MMRIAFPAVVLTALIGMEISSACWTPPKPPPETTLSPGLMDVHRQRDTAYVMAGNDRLRQISPYRESPLRLTVKHLGIRRSSRTLVLWAAVTDTRTGAPPPTELHAGLGPMEWVRGATPPMYLFPTEFPIPIAPDGDFSFEYPIDHASRFVIVLGSEPALIFNVGNLLDE